MVSEKVSNHMSEDWKLSDITIRLTEDQANYLITLLQSERNGLKGLSEDMKTNNLYARTYAFNLRTQRKLSKSIGHSKMPTLFFSDKS